MVPPQRSSSELDSFRSSLPVQEHQAEILQLIKENRVVLVVGATGSGKTTQVRQSDTQMFLHFSPEQIMSRTGWRYLHGTCYIQCP